MFSAQNDFRFALHPGLPYRRLASSYIILWWTDTLITGNANTSLWGLFLLVLRSYITNQKGWHMHNTHPIVHVSHSCFEKVNRELCVFSCSYSTFLFYSLGVLHYCFLWTASVNNHLPFITVEFWPQDCWWLNSFGWWIVSQPSSDTEVFKTPAMLPDLIHLFYHTLPCHYHVNVTAVIKLVIISAQGWSYGVAVSFFIMQRVFS